MVTISPPPAMEAATRYIQKYPNDSTKLPQISAPTPLLRGRATENVAMALPLRSGLACSIAIARVVALAIAKPTMKSMPGIIKPMRFEAKASAIRATA